MSEFKQVVAEGTRTLWKKIKRILLGLFLLLVVGGAAYVWVCGWTYSEGTRAGQLVKVTTKGVIFKTFEGQLNLGGLSSGDAGGIIGNSWEFSTTKRDVQEKLQKLEGKQVKIHYRERYKAFVWQGKTNYFVYDVEEITN